MYQPSYLSINKDAEENTLSIWHVTPDDKVKSLIHIHSHSQDRTYSIEARLIFISVAHSLSLCQNQGIHEWNFSAASVRGVR